jgi:epoxyqueuosine reductase QueG
LGNQLRNALQAKSDKALQAAIAEALTIKGLQASPLVKEHIDWALSQSSAD